ncbi:uncharacterized protein LOC111703740 [Eurytemora carolleeae]|uniref:uncharacterized protein LOC111703740 n=1 Tax=Eurytemora carolleeae TaxID=1294199 RepID=UPI000C775BDE|nr:uncharacterized protein LOC111703740 [Eurytemora carolleeae]|eukprot:XP_023331544.1 uncharacterized protein LOC111703740 [Eurytemora affinis]
MKIVLFCLFGLCTGGPTLYRLSTGEEETAEEIRIPVSSTVIPLDDLPEFNVGFGFGLVDSSPVKKPSYLKDIKLITSKNKHRFLAPAGVQKLSRDEFEQFASNTL